MPTQIEGAISLGNNSHHRIEGATISEPNSAKEKKLSEKRIYWFLFL